jgi:hypothetical protein
MSVAMSVRLELPIEKRLEGEPSKVTAADAKIRQTAQEMGVVVSRIKVRDDVIHLYGTKVVN